jgi:hypothetical protein
MKTRALVVLVGLAASGFLTGCGGPPSEGDYVEACLAKPQAVEDECRCRAREARPKLSDKAWEAFVLDAQGKDEESARLLASLSMDEQSDFVGVAIVLRQKCSGESG